MAHAARRVASFNMCTLASPACCVREPGCPCPPDEAAPTAAARASKVDPVGPASSVQPSTGAGVAAVRDRGGATDAVASFGADTDHAQAA